MHSWDISYRHIAIYIYIAIELYFIVAIVVIIFGYDAVATHFKLSNICMYSIAKGLAML